MQLKSRDVSWYVKPRKFSPVRLVVAITAADRLGSYQILASIDRGEVFTGQFAPKDEWAQASDVSAQTAVKNYTSANTGATLGIQLFTALFSGNLSRCWAQAVEQARSRGGGLHVVIRSSDLSVHALPWELLWDPVALAGPVALEEGCSVIREHEASSEEVAVKPESVDVAALHVLVVTADVGPISQTNDPEIVAEAFLGAEIDVVSNVSDESLGRVLSERDRHIVHVLASGVRNRSGQQSLMLGPPDNPKLMTTQELISAVDQRRERPRLVVLAACDSDIIAAELALTVPNVIGMRGAITDDGCLAFLRGLYQALGSGATIDQAVTSGRAQQIGFSQSLSEEWALPVLFLTDTTPLVRRAAHPVPVPALDPEPTAPPGGNLEEQADQLLYDMKASNLRSLKEQWDQVGGDVPEFVTDQIDDLEREVKHFTARLKGPAR